MIFTAAVVFSWYPNCSNAIAPYLDQANSMTYYDPVGKMPEYLGPAFLKGTPRTKVGVGFGWDTDGEVTDTKDILAKCRWAIDNGFGGIMGWHITNASTQVLDSIATYVTHTPVGIALPTAGERYARAIALRAEYDGMKRLREFNCIVPLNGSGNSMIDLKMYAQDGRLVKALFQGHSRAGNFIVPVDPAGMQPGNYVIRLTADSRSASAKALIVE